MLNKKTWVYIFRAVAFLSATISFILSIINPSKFMQPVGIIHALLWIYASITVTAKLFEKIPPSVGPKTYHTRSSPGMVWISVLIWVALLIAGYAVFILLPFRNYSLLVAAVAFLGLLESFFINAWCPFAKLITHARCCYTCRLKSWGEVMVLSPLIVLPSWWSMALFTMALALLVKNEISYKLNPQLNPLNNSCVDCSRQCEFKNKQEPKEEKIIP